MKIIAECCANHNGDKKIMRQMVKTAAEAGADVVKFQSFKADKLVDKTNYDYYKARELSYKDHENIMGWCAQSHVGFLTTVFDLDTVYELDKLGVKRVKIGSADCNSWKLIDRCLSRFEHVYISTGMHSTEERLELVHKLNQWNVKHVTLMHCVSLYPCPLDKLNLINLGFLHSLWSSIGLSDHSQGTDAAKFVVASGIECLEKHFTLDPNMEGKDQRFAMTPFELKEICDWRDTVRTMMCGEDQHPDFQSRAYIGKWGDNK
jgi:N,N'-diacetyllegionaminate synthase